MPKRCAVWLDHSKAWIVTFTPDGEPNVDKLESGVTATHKATGGARARTPYLHASAARNSVDEKRMHQLSKFYDTIISKIRDRSRVLLVGPGLARQELAKAMDDLPGQFKPKVLVRPADKMTERQLVALARKELQIQTPP
jgi:hypothetical protein